MESNFETKPLGNQNNSSVPSQSAPVGRPILDQATRARIDAQSQPTSRLAPLFEFYRANKWYVWGVLAALVVIAVLAFFAFRPNDAPLPEANISITTDAPETAPSGAEIIYKIKVQNDDSKKLVGMEMELIYPENVRFVSSSPEAKNSGGTLLPVPDLLPGQNIILFVKLRLSGSIDQSQTVRTKLRYHYENFASEFSKDSEFSTRLTAAQVALDITGPQNATGGGVQSFEVNYKNNSDNTIENARVQIEYPQGFSFAASNPEPSLSDNTWNIGTIRPGDSGKISFQGTVSSTQGAASFLAKLVTFGQNGATFVQAESEFVMQLSASPLSLIQTLEGSRSSEVVSPGDDLEFVLEYRNNAQTVARGVIVTATLDSKALDFGSISAEGGIVNNTTITWNAASGVSNLEQLNPGESGSVRFSVQVKNPPVNDSSKDVTVKSAVKIKSNEYNTFLPGNDLTVKIRTQAGLSGSLEHVGGALPPRVGNQTTYRVTLALRNTTSDITNGTLTAFIPLPAGAFDKASITTAETNNVTFDAATGKLTWKVGALPAHTGDFSPLKRLAFTLTISPSSSQVGDSVLLVRSIGFSGTESFTGETVALQFEDITTNDTGDANDGRVEN